MKTDDLISLLAQDAPVRFSLGQRLALALAVGVVVSGALLLSTVGLRVNLLSALETVRVPFKMSVTLLLAITASRLVFRIGKPGLNAWPLALCLLFPLALLAFAIAAELVMVPESLWSVRLMGAHAAFCVFFIPVLSLVPLAGFLKALQSGAPENPGLAGASAGLAASGIAAALYAWHCPDDSPLFLATWYGLAICLVTVVGYMTGRKVLRW
ncbi:NrsF family protein [Rhizobium sp.]|jgi:hypothetical protein|uniref:NrsF family protein n=1 Tax=Rhizobium sp. TaxID=391 RepID=UPI000E87ED11|nr:DUF1109 domain-containing protein [Rhizobium sp.]